MEHGLKDIKCYVQKHIPPRAICYNPLVCDKQLGSLVYCETRLLTHWGWVMHICISKLTIIGSDNGLSPHRRQAIIWTNAGILLIGPLGTNFSEILIEILTFLFKKLHLKVSSAKRRPFCLSLNVLRHLRQFTAKWTDIAKQSVDQNWTWWWNCPANIV